MLKAFLALFTLFSTDPTWEPPAPCWNGKASKAYVKDVTAANGRFHVTVAVKPTGASFIPNKAAEGWRVGYDPATQTEWVQAVSFPLEGGLASRDIVAADVTVTAKAIVGQPKVDLVPWWYTGYAIDEPNGAVSGLAIDRFQLALSTPGWINGTGQLTAPDTLRMRADDFAFDAQNAVEETDLDGRPIRYLTLFVTSANPAPAALAYADLSKMSLTLYHCPIDPDSQWP